MKLIVEWHREVSFGDIYFLNVAHENGLHNYLGHLAMAPEEYALFKATLQEGAKMWQEHELEVEFHERTVS